MIQANEVRIGNWIEYDNRFFQIDTIAEVFPTLNTGEFGIGVVDWNNIKPIPLTEEILFKCCFILDFNDCYTDVNGNFYLFINRGNVLGLNNGNIYYSASKGAIHIKYLHQLQNLYFALIGKELEINL